MKDCKHVNRKLVNYSYSTGMHGNTFECLDCGHTFATIDPPIIYDYDYNKEYIVIDGVVMHQEDYDILKAKCKAVKEVL